MVLRAASRPFVYGRFFMGKKVPTSFDDPRVAIEILREFSSTEFVGKLYVNVGSWIPATWLALNEHKWYQWYRRGPDSPLVRAALHFYMEGSGIWKLNYLRDESDETGPYIAAALKLGN